MKAFFILKPDALERPNVISTYQDIVPSTSYIENRHQYLIDSWVKLSCLLYEPSTNNNLEDLITLRHHLLTTIKCYDYLYYQKPALIDIFDVPNDINILKDLEKIKYKIRKEHVLKTDKNYLKFNNLTNEILNNELINIDIDSLDVSHLKVSYNESLEIPGYNMAFLNCIHTSDPQISAYEKDLLIIEKSKTLTKKIKL